MSPLGLGLGLPNVSSYNLNSVFDFNALDPYYYFDPSSLSAGSVHTWHGRVVGSDNDAHLTITQSTSADQPTAAGTVVTFNDNSDYLHVPSGFVEPSGGSWQIVGTSLGTFSYKVNANAVSELNLLGNLGGTAYRQSGDLYGIILLPSSATAQDIQGSRKLLIDKGATAGATGDVTSAWRDRSDIVQFDGNMSSVTNVSNAWTKCTSLTSFSSDLPSATDARSAWFRSSSLTSFSSELPLVTNASSAWAYCFSLTSFSSELPSVTNASAAWRRCTSLTSFSSDLPSATDASSAWSNCPSLTSFSSDLPLVTDASLGWYNCNSLTSFSSDLPAVNNATQAWAYCSSLTDFSAGVFANWNPSSIGSGIFNLAWYNCTSLTAQSVENILTSIDSSGKYATSNGTSGGSAIADAGIDIDYDGTTLSSATYIAVASLKSKGWVIIVNNVTL